MVTACATGKRKGAARPPRSAVWGRRPRGGTLELSWRTQGHVAAEPELAGGARQAGVRPFTDLALGAARGARMAGVGDLGAQALGLHAKDGRRERLADASGGRERSGSRDPREAAEDGGLGAAPGREAKQPGPPRASCVPGLRPLSRPVPENERRGSECSLCPASPQAEGAGGHRKEDGGSGCGLVSGAGGRGPGCRGPGGRGPRGRPAPSGLRSAGAASTPAPQRQAHGTKSPHLKQKAKEKALRTGLCSLKNMI